MKILSVGAKLLHTNRKKDGHHEANSHFSQVCGGA